ncbi:hypothetical protein [Rhizosphaericola mali]|uniref:Uncharacterized protein n=1 Tax=Rhizosphaericola mali TaxID=2545455 RepID=A0A5P2G3M2_9BACT|nr:hypothetical protein [Rhizosphaericola mali]QES88729.1 hypothetical protein E0W69_008720 [Rhizosphaericola mali]
MKLNLQRLENVEVLTRSQLKNVLGGFAPSTSSNQSCSAALEQCHDYETIPCCSGLECKQEYLGDTSIWVCG